MQGFRDGFVQGSTRYRQQKPQELCIYIYIPGLMSGNGLSDLIAQLEQSV